MNINISQRWAPGGDKYMQHKADEQRGFWEAVEIEQEEILSTIRTVVSTWTENEIELYHHITAELKVSPVLVNFLKEYPEWDREGLYDVIEAEINRVSELCNREAK